VTWTKTGGNAHAGAFAADTQYTGTVLLTAHPGYTFKGIPETGTGTFAHGNNTPTHEISGDFTTATVTINFAKTAKHVISGRLNLTSRGPAPTAGGTPLTEFDALPSFTGTISWAPGDSNFDAFTSYTATVTLTPGGNYEFDSGVYITHSGGTVGIDSEDGGVITVPISFAALKTRVTQTILTSYIPAPVTGASGISYFNASQYSGNVTWKKGSTPHSGPFAADTVYTAVVTLTPHSGYTFQGMANNAFTYAGATQTSADNYVTSYVVELTFNATTKIPISGSIDLTLYLPAPVRGAQPVTVLGVPVGSSFTGSVTWSPSGSSPWYFAPDTAYTATVTLTPSAGYTFVGGAPSFTHSQSNETPVFAGTGDNRTVTITFVKTAALTPVTLRNLGVYVPKPVVGGTPVRTFTTVQYTAQVSWEKLGIGGQPAYSTEGPAYTPNTPFVAGLTYKATIYLTALPGYSLDRGPDFFSYGDEPSVRIENYPSFTDEGYEVVLFFETPVAPPPPIMISDLNDLWKFVPSPVAGATPLSSFSTGRYVGALSWREPMDGNALLNSPFVKETIYIADIMLTPFPGYAFDEDALYAVGGSPPHHSNIVLPGGASLEDLIVSDDEVYMMFMFLAVPDPEEE
jgi:hypothetical protein